MYEVDRTVGIGHRASDLMRAYGRCASPRAYELWYTYVTGLKPALNAAIRSHLATCEFLTEEDTDRFYAAHICSGSLSDHADKASTGLLLEMEKVINLIEAAVGSTARYGHSLEALRGDLKPDIERAQIREIVETLIGTTRAVATSNQELQSRLKASRGEVEGLRKALEEVRAESLTDAVTGLANRKQFEMALTAGVIQAQATRSSLILIVIDIDHFKRFNDSYGHLTGDQILRLVGATMRENVASGSTLARFGGEEFAVLAPGVERAEAFACAEKIRRDVMGRELLRRSTGESLGRVTISVGLAELRADDSATSLLERADAAMYRAKRNGRNACVADWEFADIGMSSAA